jgi:hypothetical protein
MQNAKCKSEVIGTSTDGLIKIIYFEIEKNFGHRKTTHCFCI